MDLEVQVALYAMADTDGWTTADVRLDSPMWRVLDSDWEQIPGLEDMYGLLIPPFLILNDG